MSLFEKFGTLKSMLCSETPIDLNNENYIAEFKLDGLRFFAFVDTIKGEVRFQSRHLKDKTFCFPELKDIHKQFSKKGRFILDGEMVCFINGLDNFNLIQGRDNLMDKAKISMRAKNSPCCFVAFDVIYADKDIINLSLMDRKKILDDLFVDCNLITKSPYVEGGKGKALFERAKQYDREGVVLKDRNSRYVFDNRGTNWIKVKNKKTADVVIVGYTEGEGKRNNLFGALILAEYNKGNLECVGRVGTGFNDKSIKIILDKMASLKCSKGCVSDYHKKFADQKVFWVKPELVAEVEHLGISKNGILRQPSFKRLRTDKKPLECETQ